MKQLFEKIDTLPRHKNAGMCCFDVPIGKRNCGHIGITDAKRIRRKKDLLKARGEFAGYAIEKHHVMIFRDRLGARNIYYSVQDDAIYISTDLALLGQKLKPGPNLDYIKNEYLNFQIPFSDETFFKDIKKVMPGEIVTIGNEGIQKEKYWKPSFANDQLFDPDELAELIVDAVDFRKNLLDGDFTSYLSGGIDSSTITLMSQPKKCFSGFYEEEGYSELDYIRSVIEDTNLEFHKVLIDEENFQQVLPSVAGIAPDPSCGLGVIPQSLVASAAAFEEYKYAFTGEGGDEIFLGYNWNHTVFTLAQAARGLLKDRYMVRYEPMVDKILKDGFPTFVGGLLARGDDLLFATKKVLDVWDESQCVENNEPLHRS
jgi:asparagine synthase (glutamine-hydrolysing)